jgi:competence protein ComGC
VNPYQSPNSGKESEAQSSAFFRLPNTVLEWLVIIGLIGVIVALCLPNVDEGTEAARRKLGVKAPIAGSESPAPAGSELGE